MLLLAIAEAWGGNHETMAFATVTRRGGEHPWGLELGASWLVAVGDPCNHWTERRCRRADWWPTLGTRGALGWRGGSRVGLTGELVAGVGTLDMHSVGFVPRFHATSTAGGAVELGAPPELRLGGSVSRALAWTPPSDATVVRQYGEEMVSTTFSGRARWSGGWASPQWGVGFEAATGAGDYK